MGNLNSYYKPSTSSYEEVPSVGEAQQKTPNTQKTPIAFTFEDGDFPPGFDPRSPTQEIRRTPIVLGSTSNETSVSDENFDPDQIESDKLTNKRAADFDKATGGTAHMCRDLRKRLFITQKLNMSDAELLNLSGNAEDDKEN